MNAMHHAQAAFDRESWLTKLARIRNEARAQGSREAEPPWLLAGPAVIALWIAVLAALSVIGGSA